MSLVGKKICVKTRWCNEWAIVEKREYTNGRTALVAVDAYDQLVMKFTVNVPDYPLEDNEVIIKTYSENEGALECLIKNNIVGQPKRHVQTGYVQSPVVDLLI